MDFDDIFGICKIWTREELEINPDIDLAKNGITVLVYGLLVQRLILIQFTYTYAPALRYDLTYTYKVAFSLVNGAANDLLTLTSLIHSTSTRGHMYKLFPHCNRVDLYKYFFSLIRVFIDRILILAVLSS